jgi:drug/metabolite transporter (DMT)-like permease
MIAQRLVRTDGGMQTIYDWVTVAIFAGLIVVFLQRSVGDTEPQDSILSYLPPAIGCAVSNWCGNKGVEEGSAAYQALAALGIAAVLAYTYYVIKPFQRHG